jgi:ATP-dependent Clp protease protease subunit
MLEYLNKNEEEEEKEEKEEKEGHGILNKRMEEIYLQQRRVYFWGVVDDKSMEKIISKVLFLDAHEPGKEIDLYIRSPGGSVTAGLALLDVMNMIQSPVNTICMG